MRYPSNLIPAVTTGLTPDFLNTTTLRLGLKGYNAAKLRYSFEGIAALAQTDWENLRDLAVSVPPTEGSKTLYCEFMSLAGVRAGPFSYPFVLDLTPPQLELFRTEILTHENSACVGLIGSDRVTRVEAMLVQLDNAPAEWEEYSIERTVSMPDREGAHRVSFQLRDQAGNTSLTKTATVTVDRTPPSPVLEVPESTDEKQLTLSGFIELGATLLVNGKAVPVAPDGSFSTTVSLAEGVNRVTLSAVDRAGNEFSTTYHVACVPPTPPIPIQLGVIPAAAIGAWMALRLIRKPKPEQKLKRAMRRIELPPPPTGKERLGEAEKLAKRRARKARD